MADNAREYTTGPAPPFAGGRLPRGAVARPGGPEDARAALLGLATGGWRQAVLAVAARLDLCTMLGARTADLEEVCYSLGTPRQATRLFLAACEGLGLVAEREGEYRPGPLGRALADPTAAELVEWVAAAGDARVRDALWAALRGTSPGASPSTPGEGDQGRATVRALGLPYGDVLRGADDAGRAAGVVRALHSAPATALAVALPVPDDGLLVEVGGRGVYARALLARHERLHAAIVGSEPGMVEAADSALPGAAGRVRLLPGLADLGEVRGAVAVVAQTTRTLSPAALKAELGRLAGFLVRDAPVAVVGPFRQVGVGRPLAPLIVLLELAAGGPGWCPMASEVVDAVCASGFAVHGMLVLPEPDVAVIARRE